MQAHLLDLIESGAKLSADGSRNLVRISPQIVVKFGPDVEEAEALLMEYVGSHCPRVRVPTLLGTLGDTDDLHFHVIHRGRNSRSCLDDTVT